MKTITTITSALALMSTVAGAAVVNNPPSNYIYGTNTNGTATPPTVDWEGNTLDLDAFCNFTELANGDMTLGSDEQTWTTDQNAGASAVLSFRGTTAITVSADDTANNQIGTGSGNGAIVEASGGTGSLVGTFDADVDYVGSTWVVTYDGTNTTATATLSGSATSFGWNTNAATGTAGYMSIDINGTAKSTTPAIYDANTNYRVPHIITCTQ